MLAASGVPTNISWPLRALVGADVIVGRGPANRYGGEKYSLCVYPLPPVDSTRPSGISMAIEWYSRGTVALASVLQISVTGSHSSAAYTASVLSEFENPGPPVPPVTNTFPSGSMRAFACRRAYAIGAVLRHAGVVCVRSITSAVLVAGSDPPATRILPGWYITTPS